MIEIDDALAQILDTARAKPAAAMPLSQAVGLVLADDVRCDRDSPPWDKSMVDGYAIVAADLGSGAARLQVVEEVVAGAVPTQPVANGKATRIMTGAPLPDGADAVVMVERTRIEREADCEVVAIDNTPTKPGQNILRRATVMRAGDVVLPAGSLIGPAAVGLCAEVGAAEVTAIPRPRVAVLATGNELVPHDHVPAAGQIRNSNGPLLLAAAERAGAVPIDAGVARDDEHALRAAVDDALAADVLVLSGGVSAGVLDLVPKVLAELGVKQVFHKVRIKPGKPLWFGTVRRDETTKLVFGLPGNPVSSFVGFELFVRPALKALAGKPSPAWDTVTAKLTASFTHRGDRPTYYPVRIESTQDGWTAEPLDWRGSADLRGVAVANGLAEFVAGDHVHEAGTTLRVVCV